MRKLFTERDILEIVKSGKTEIEILNCTIITPSALDLIQKHKLKINAKDTLSEKIENKIGSRIKKIAIGSDHTGFSVKEEIKRFLLEKGFHVEDVGTHSEESCDYPDYAYAVSLAVKNSIVDRGVILDATGIPSSICANKVDGIRAAVGYNEYAVKSSREHNNSNVITFAARVNNTDFIKSLLMLWLQTDFEGGRHQKRLDKITDIERKN
ncbi:MAG: ribose 5-phosphate isomerase B [Bacteroidetes bacterium]|nr:ribose 5-phosphate isomerase B [Bacteroidota bacterium]MBU2586414.1 ribose 5-phosphate isomerase B [Bacteroidota bacterium]